MRLTATALLVLLLAVGCKSREHISSDAARVVLPVERGPAVDPPVASDTPWESLAVVDADSRVVTVAWLGRVAELIRTAMRLGEMPQGAHDHLRAALYEIGTVREEGEPCDE